MINLDRIERRANAATEGPWGFSCGDRRYIADPSTDIVGEVAPEYSGQTICVFAVASANEKDAEFIASARADVPALIARVRELEAERDEAHAQLAASSSLYRSLAAINAMARERDEAKKEAAESFKEMVMLYNDHSSTELEQQLRIEELTRERDEARAQLAAADTGAPCDGHRHCCADRRKLAEELLRVRAERDALKEKP